MPSWASTGDTLVRWFLTGQPSVQMGVFRQRFDVLDCIATANEFATADGQCWQVDARLLRVMNARCGDARGSLESFQTVEQIRINP